MYPGDDDKFTYGTLYGYVTLGELYHDDGVSLDSYEKGEYSHLQFSYCRLCKTVGSLEHSFSLPSAVYKFCFFFQTVDDPHPYMSVVRSYVKKAGYTKDFVLEHVAIFDVDKNVTSVTLNDKPVQHYYVEKSEVSPGGEIRGNGKILFAHVSAIAGWASFSRALFPSSASPQTSSAAGEQGCCSGWMKVEGALEAFPLLSCGSLCPRSDHAKKNRGEGKGARKWEPFLVIPLPHISFFGHPIC